MLDMGLGKTVITLTALDRLMYDSMEVHKALVIAPLRVAQVTWSTEAAKWDHLRHLTVSRVLGSRDQRLAALGVEADVYVINRENVAWLVDLYKRRWPFDAVIIDELSSFKDPKTRRFRALRRVRSMCKVVWGLTGTPAPNGLIDLWPQIYLLDGGARLGRTVTGYRARYFVPGKHDGNHVFEWKPRRGAAEEIYRLIGDICISMSAADHLKVPERVDISIPVELPADGMERYRALEEQTVLELEGKPVDAVNAAALTNKLLQMADGAVYDGDHVVHEVHSAKLDALEDLIEAANGNPILVFYAFRHDLERIQRRFPQVRTLDSPEALEAWNRGEIPILAVHPAGAAHGLNLQDGGHIAVWFGLTWSLELYQQACARLHRQGQKEAVTVYHLVAVGTVDEDVMRVLSGKAGRQEALLEAVKARIQRWRR